MPRRKGYNKLAHQQQQQQLLNHQKETAKLKRRIIEKVLSNSHSGNTTAFNLDLLVDGWLEIESDPGTFSLLIEDFGCLGAQVDEVYDLDQKFDGPVFGFIFLFKWLNHQHKSINNRYQNYPTTSLSQETKLSTFTKSNGRGAATNNDPGQSSTVTIIDQPNDDTWSYVVDENIITKMFFAKQMISNSCATHALVSILLNCDHEQLNLGPTLTRLKEHTKVMDPENKGYAIGNVPELAKAHNSHASYSSLYSRDRPNAARGASSFVIRGNQRTNMQLQQNQPDTYHFVSYVPINNRLYELDGLKSYPIDHGPFDPKEGWTEKFRRVIKKRLFDNNLAGDGTMADDIRYNLMAVVPDRRLYLKTQIQNMKHHLRSSENTLKQLTKQITTGATAPTVSACISVATDNRDLNMSYSPCSNGTLTASECESICHEATANQDIHMDNGDNSSVTNNSEIPNPPYSPLSICTLTASEAGSEFNDPLYYDDTLFSDDPSSGKAKNSPSDGSEKYFFVKFDPSQDFPNSDDVKTDESNVHEVDKAHAVHDMCRLNAQIKQQIEKLETALSEEHEKRSKYKIDNSRRTHNYEPFIMTFLSMLAKDGKLADLIERNLGLSSSNLDEVSQQGTSNASPQKTRDPQSTSSAPAHNHNLKSRLQHKSQSTTTEKSNDQPTQKPKNKYYKYVSTGRPRGRPKKNPTPAAVDAPNQS